MHTQAGSEERLRKERNKRMDQTKGELTKVVTVQITTIQRASEDDIDAVALQDVSLD